MKTFTSLQSWRCATPGPASPSAPPSALRYTGPPPTHATGRAALGGDSDSASGGSCHKENHDAIGFNGSRDRPPPSTEPIAQPSDVSWHPGALLIHVPFMWRRAAGGNRGSLVNKGFCRV
jgi:hypothetical protein